VDAQALPHYLRNRVLMRRAGVWSGLAHQRARSEKPGEAAAASDRALTELAGVVKTELTDEDSPAYNDAAMRVGASRWASSPAPAITPGKRPYIMAAPGKPGETCILLIDEKNDTEH